MDAKLMLNERHTISEISFVEMVVWRVPSPLPGSCHAFKYRLALVVNGICVLRYDNEAVLEVSGGPTRSPYDPQFNPLSITRIEAIVARLRAPLLKGS